MGENKFFRWGEFVIREINNSVLVWFCNVAKSLLEKKFEFPFILDRKFSFFPFVNGGYISAESNEIEERQELSNSGVGKLFSRRAALTISRVAEGQGLLSGTAA